MSDLAVISPDAFAVAWPGEQFRIRALSEIWLASFKSRHTRVSYARDLTAWLAWCAGCRVTPGQARAPHVIMWIERQRLDGAADASIARRVSAVSSWYLFLIEATAGDEAPLAERNPARTRARPKVDPDWSPTVGLSLAEADRLIAAADARSATAGALIRLLLTDGLRIGSALSACVEDLGWDRGHRTLDLHVKGGTLARVPLPPPVADAVGLMLAQRGDPASGPLFTLPSGAPAYQMWAWRLVRSLGRRARIPQAGALSPHALRATAITVFLDSGGSLRDAQDFAGHRDPRTTRRYDKRRHNLDRHGSYLLATKYAARRDGH